MNDIRALLKIAGRRLQVSSFLSHLHGAAVVFAAVALALMIADRLPGEAFVPWMWVGPGLAILTLATAAVLWWRSRPSEAHVAIVVDERLDLREKLSNALHCQGRDDAFAQAAIEDAILTARNPRTRELLCRRFAIVAPCGWYISPLVVLAAIMVSLLSPLNLFARDKEQLDPNVIAARNEAQQSVEAVVKLVEEKPLLAKELGDLGDIAKEGTDFDAPKNPDEFRREALKSVTRLEKKLEELISGEKGQALEAIENAFKNLKSPDADGPGKELAEALANGNFSQAQQLLQDMMQQLESGQLSEEQKQALAEQLQNIAEQLKQLAEQQLALENALRQAGMDPQLAQNPQALQQAIENSQNLNEQQKQQLQQMAQAQQMAQQMCQGLGGACQNMAQAMQGGQAGQLGQAGQEMAGQLSDLEQLQQLLREARAAASACRGQCQGLGMGLGLQQLAQGSGAFGNRGQGAGGRAPIAPTPTGTREVKAPVNTVEGDIIAKQLFQGQQIRGESKAKLVEVIHEASKGVDEAQAEERRHRKYDEAIKHYFGELEKLTESLEADSGAKSSPQPQADAPADE